MLVSFCKAIFELQDWYMNRMNYDWYMNNSNLSSFETDMQNMSSPSPSSVSCGNCSCGCTASPSSSGDRPADYHAIDMSGMADTERKVSLPRNFPI